MRQKPDTDRNTTTRLSILFAVAAIALLSGCYKATFIRNPSAMAGGAEHDEWTDFFIFGLVGNQQVDVRRFCGDAAPALVRTGGNAGTTLIGALTIGIYTPRKVYVVCGASPARNVAYQIETDARGEPSMLVRRSPSHTQQTAVLALGTGRWTARFGAGEAR